MDGAGKTFASTLVDALWYIDGYHHVFEKQGCKLLDFVSFVGLYYTQDFETENSVNNMSGLALSFHASSLLWVFVLEKAQIC